LVGEDGLWKIPNRLHRELVSGLVKLPQYAGSIQRILEITSRQVGQSVRTLNYRATSYKFNPDGTLDRSDQVDAVGLAIGAASPQKGTIHDIVPTLKKRRWKSEHSWKPQPEVLQTVYDDVMTKPSRIPKLKA
jgi:hypothetical protein